MSVPIKTPYKKYEVEVSDKSSNNWSTINQVFVARSVADALKEARQWYNDNCGFKGMLPVRFRARLTK